MKILCLAMLQRDSLTTMNHDEATSSIGPSPFDTPASSATRFAMEIIAWVGGPWAAATVAGSRWAAVPALLILFALPALFNTPGDKHSTPIATPGPIRIAIEALLIIVATASAWYLWPSWVAISVSVLAVTTVAFGMRRYRWLATGS